MMDIGYVEMIEDVTSAFVSTADARSAVDQVLAETPVIPKRPVDRDAWLRGDTAGQSSMLELAGVARRGSR